jgi:hypothetical protein
MHIEPGHEPHGEQSKASPESVSGSAAEPSPALPPTAKTAWICPMHASVVRGAPGDCPLCGMKLEARTVADGAANTRRPPRQNLATKEDPMIAKGQSASPPFRIPVWLGACLFSAIALYFLWDEHKVHILSVLPYLLLASCPLIHLFMHHGHGHGDSSHAGHSHHEGES